MDPLDGSTMGNLCLAGGDFGPLSASIGGAPNGAYVLLPAGRARLRQGGRAATQAPASREQHGVIRRCVRKDARAG